MGGCALYTEQKLDSYMKKLFTALLFTSFCVLANSQSLTPLNAWMKERPNWQNDKSELAYFTLRCNVFLKFVGAYFITRSDKQAGIDRGKEIESNAEAFLLPSVLFSEASGYKVPELLKRADAIQKKYVEQMSSNKDLTNSIFEGYIGEDFKICINAAPEFRLISEEIKKRGTTAK